MAVGGEFQAGHGSLGAGAEVLLADGEADAVPVVRVLGLFLALARVAVLPQLVLGGLVENLVQAQCTGGNGALGVLHAGLEDVLPAQLDGVHAQALGHLVHHHLGGGHGLQGAVAAHGTGFDAAGMVGGGGQVASRQVVDGLRGGCAHGGHGRAVVDAAAAVDIHVRAEDLERQVVLLHRQLVVHVEGVALDTALELLVAVIGQAHRYTVAVHRGQGGVEDEDVVVLGAVSHGVAGVHVQLRDLEARRRQHVRGLLGHFEGALGGHDEMQGAAGGVVPAVAVVRFQGSRLDRLGLEALVEDHPAFRRGRQLLLHLLGVEQALGGQVSGRVARSPGGFSLADQREQHAVLEAGEAVRVKGRGAANANETEAAIGVALVERGLGAVADHLLVELEDVLRPAVTVEVFPDQQRHRMADEHRHLALGQKGIGAVAFREGDAIAREVGGGHHAVGFQLIAQHGQVEALVELIGTGCLEQQGMALLLRPTGHVLGADVTGEDLAATDLADPVDAPAGLAARGVPGLRSAGDLRLEQRGEGLAAQGRQSDADTGYDAALEEGAAGQFRSGHTRTSWADQSLPKCFVQ
ncbi:hypothetical protein D3C84_495740 [compost metagenome]